MTRRSLDDRIAASRLVSLAVVCVCSVLIVGCVLVTVAALVTW